MSTRSNIGYKIKDGKKEGQYAFVYCHFDGYLEGVGERLKNEYNSYDEIVELVQGGDMSFPGTPYTSRGEDYNDLKPKIVEDINKTFRQEYTYIWRDDKLIYSENGKTWEDL